MMISMGLPPTSDELLEAWNRAKFRPEYRVYHDYNFSDTLSNMHIHFAGKFVLSPIYNDLYVCYGQGNMNAQLRDLMVYHGTCMLVPHDRDIATFVFLADAFVTTNGAEEVTL
jgi:hypothetical protein